MRDPHVPEGVVLQTDDLFLGAFGLLCGGELVGLEVHGVNGRRSAVFQIEGRGLGAAERDYYRGAVLVDLRLLKSEVRRLKDMAFQALRREERKDACTDQPGSDRRHQGPGRYREGRR
jgi:hypothetical protein